MNSSFFLTAIVFYEKYFIFINFCNIKIKLPKAYFVFKIIKKNLVLSLILFEVLMKLLKIKPYHSLKIGYYKYLNFLIFMHLTFINANYFS